MPKMKTKSSCKKRFKVTASGRIKRGLLSKADEKIIKPMMPYSR